LAKCGPGLATRVRTGRQQRALMAGTPPPSHVFACVAVANPVVVRCLDPYSQTCACGTGACLWNPDALFISVTLIIYLGALLAFVGWVRRGCCVCA
jgi:hypothetical protein